MPVWLRTLAPDGLRGLRAALATVVPFYLATVLQRPELAWVALGGWLGSLVDSGGARSTRAFLIGSFALLGGVVVALATALSPWPAWGICFLALIAWSASLLRALGGSASSFGTILLITACIAAGGSSASALQSGLHFALGASWAVVLSSVVWPIWTHWPLRRAVATVLDRLIEYARALHDRAAQGTPPYDPTWTILARTQQRRVRAALEEARLVALLLRGRRSGETALGSRLRVLLGDAETQFSALVATGEELEGDPSRHGPLSHALVNFASSAEAAKIRLLSSSFFARASEPEADSPPPSSLRSTRESATLSNPEHAEPTPTLRAQLIEQLDLARDSLSPASPFFRHALRVTIAVSAAAIVGLWLSPAHVPWVTVTTVGVLQPYPGATVRRAVERVVGTVLGSIVAVVLMNLVRDPLWLSLTLLPLSAAAVITRPRSYRWFTFFLTPVFILFSGIDLSWWTSVTRSANALLGGVLALAASALIMPSWERERLDQALARVLTELAAYARCSLVAPPEVRKAEAHPRERRAVGLALGEAETSLERMLSEPLRSKRRSQYAMQLLTYARRLSNSLTAYNQNPAASVNDPTSASARRATLHFVLGALDAARSELAGASPPPAADALSWPEGLAPEVASALRRVLRYAELVGRLPAPPPPPEAG